MRRSARYQGASFISNPVSPPEGCDLLSGGRGNDLIDGGSGNDRLYGGHGEDILDGTIGTFAATAPIAETDVRQPMAKLFFVEDIATKL